MATLKDVEMKIKAVKKTKQITKAMNMVATSRLRGAQTNMELSPYADKFAEVLGSLAGKAGEEASPLLVPREEVKKVHIVSVHLGPGAVRRLQHQPDRGGRKSFMQKQPRGREYSFTCFRQKGAGLVPQEEG